MRRGDAVSRFTHEVPSLDSYWRAIVLFGQNVASYKFALAGALLDVAGGSETVSLDELALPFAARIAEHLKSSDKQATSPRSRFLDDIRAYNRGEIDEDALRSAAVQRGFNNVIDAFHIVDRDEVGERFFLDERRTGGGIRITEAMLALASSAAAPDLAVEVEARWQLVETAWELNLPSQLLTVDFEPSTSALVVPRRRTNITGAREALNGYQKGHCFYCYSPIDVVGRSGATCHVDHVFPWSLGGTVGGAPIDGVWNLVLACPRCNGWQEKSDRPPAIRYVDRLRLRNEFLIASHHPLRPTLIAQTGGSEQERDATLRAAASEATVGGVRREWSAPEEFAPAF